MSTNKLVWDDTGKKEFEFGVDHGVLYPATTEGYGDGVAWNGLTAVTETPEGAEPTDLYADNIKYGTLLSAEKLTLTIEHYATPVEFYPCDGIVIENGVMITGQSRQAFGFSFRSKVGNDANADAGYKLHLVYGCKAGVAERAFGTINDSPEVITFSRSVSTTPVMMANGKATAEVIIDSRTAPVDGLKALEDALYGTDSVKPKLPTPDEVLAMMVTVAAITPASATVAPEETQQFTCNVPCAWSTNSVKSTISGAGLLTIALDEEAETVLVTATPTNTSIDPVTATVTVG